jgi:peptidyl-prolyl cis-trans isomerase SurA
MKPLLALALLLFSLGSGSLRAAADTSPKAAEAITALRDLGKFDEAEKAAQALVAARTKELGAEDKETLRARILLALVYSELSKEAEKPDAEAQLRELLPVVTKVFGAQQRDTLVCQSILIETLTSQGKNAAAADLCRTWLPIANQVLGATDPDTLKARRLYAKILYRLDKTEEAEQEQREVLDLCQRTFGPEAKETLRTRMVLASASSEIGTPDSEAETELRALLPLMTKVFGAEHLETQMCLYALSQNLRFQEKYAEAVKERQKWITITTHLYGPENPETLELRLEQAKDLDALGKDAAAAQERRAVLAIQERTLGAEDKATLKTCHFLALSLKKLKKTEEALAYARRALAGRTHLFGKDANDTDASQRLVNQLTYASPQALALQVQPPKTRPVAMVDGALIYASEVQQTIAAQQQVIRFQYQSDPDRMAKELAGLNRSALGNLIDMWLLINEFRRTGGFLKPEYVDDDLNNIIKENFNGNRDTFVSELTKNGLTLEEFRTLREHLVIMNAMRSRFAGDIKLKDEDVRGYFEKNKHRWLTPEQVKIRTISIPKTQADARKLADSLRKKILNGADFAEIARASSQDSHAEDGGAWDWLPLSDFTDGVRKVAAKTKKGQVSEIIEQDGTFIILRVDDRRAPAPPAFEKVQSEVTKALEQEKSKERADYKINKLREKADIQMMDAL